ncbi:hypothetical protein V5740_01665 [Croceibacterium sp. TMG7-5b_MA50]|uniref:hypothetical protein n=1 Tax=Croceibacterium sp. TMG7-5b_MA50 TaxID=3121290 RepID=UPI0032216A60
MSAVKPSARWFAWFVSTVPWRSRLGARGLLRHVDTTVPAIWQQDFPGKRTLIIGTGPSLDRVPPEFFDDFDTLVYVNFALRRASFDRPEYFFTMDLGPVREFLDRVGSEPFERLGPERCVVAPVFLDFWHRLTKRGRAMFTWLRYDAAGWRWERLGSIPFPVVLRYHPRQPDWGTFEVPPTGRTIPIVETTSALSAVMFAAMCGSRDINLIGCDFSDGRAASMGAEQNAPGIGVFNAAREQFGAMHASLASQGIRLTNHSWTV